MGSPVAFFLASLFQLLLCFGICEAETELDTIDFVGDVVEVIDDLFSNIAILESGGVSGEWHHSGRPLTEQSQPPCRCPCQAPGRSWWRWHGKA